MSVMNASTLLSTLAIVFTSCKLGPRLPTSSEALSNAAIERIPIPRNPNQIAIMQSIVMDLCKFETGSTPKSVSFKSFQSNGAAVFDVQIECGLKPKTVAYAIVQGYKHDLKCRTALITYDELSYRLVYKLGANGWKRPIITAYFAY
jgi:hypothetical protein